MKLLYPADLRAKVLRLWESQRVMRAWLAEEALFPYEIPLSPPAGTALVDRFIEVRDWIAALKAEAREAKGYGYTLLEQPVAHRQLGAQRLPVRAVVPALEDALRLVGKWQAFGRFEALVQQTRQRLPALEEFLRAKPLAVLEHAADWGRLLDVCAYFAAHPRPGCYVRELNIPGVDTKFIQRHQALLMEMLAAALPPEAQDDTVSRGAPQAFERRFGLRYEPAIVRFRVLDPALAVGGFTDVAVPVQELARWPAAGVRRVFITENQTNGLTFPAVDGAVVIFGLGYAVRALGELPWLAARRIFYWGDLDTHGFGILAALRQRLPHVESLLMDEATLLAHRWAWGQEGKQRTEVEPSALRAEEYRVYEGLRADRWGERVRLEQERLSFGWVEQAIAALGDR